MNTVLKTAADISLGYTPKSKLKTVDYFNDACKALEFETNNPQLAMDNALAKATIWAHYRGRIIERIKNAAGDNTVSAGLQRQYVLREGAMRAFRTILAPLLAFSTKFDGVRLEGTNIVEVPYYPLETAASTTFVAANGYVDGTTSTQTIEVNVNRRKYQAMRITSSELRRQPGLDSAQLMNLKAEKLAKDVLTDILSSVTEANYGVAALSELPEAFDSNDIATLGGVVKAANWPDQPKALVVSADRDLSLMQDPTVRNAAYFRGDVARTGKIGKIMGFDYIVSNHIPDNGENLNGFVAHPDALYVAFSPIPPVDPVKELLAAYEVIMDAESGVTLEYRRFGNTNTDAVSEIIEANYGFSRGNPAALKRITS